MSTFPNHWHVKPHFLMDEGLLSISPICSGQLVKILLTLEPYGIFGSTFAYLYIYILSSHWYANGDEGLPIIILAGRDLLVKIPITLKLHDIF